MKHTRRHDKRKHSTSDNSLGNRGIVHAFSADSSSSKRTCFAKQVIENSIRGFEPIGNSRVRKGLKEVKTVNYEKKDVFKSKILGGENSGKKIFFSAKDNINNEVDVGDNGIWVGVRNNPAIDLIDTNQGMMQYDESSGIPVFVLLGRSDSLSGLKKPHKFVAALEHVEKLKPETSTVRGGAKEVRYERGTVGANYTTTGVAAKRAGRGLYKKDLRSDEMEKVINAMKSFIQHKCKSYINRKIKRSFRAVIERLELDLESVKTINKQKELEEAEKEKAGSKGKVATKKKERTKLKKVEYFPSMATGRNTCLQIHTDEDAFLSVVVVYREADIMHQKVHNYSKIDEQSEIVKYFTFETRVSVAL